MVKKIKTERESGIELLKIIAIFMIVIFHCIQTYSCGNTSFLSVEHINIFASSENPDMIILQLMYYLGNIGNVIFVFCSAWFLVDSDVVKPKKIGRIIIELLVVSYMFFVICLAQNIKITELEKWRTIYPLTYSGNWFISCYVLLYIFHPLLNFAIKKLDQKRLTAYCCVFFFCYSIWGTIKEGQYFQSSIINFIMLYFFTAYIKKYMADFTLRKKNNLILLLVGICGIVAVQLITNHLDFTGTLKSENIHHWCKVTNPFLIMISSSLFNLFRQLKFKNYYVNYFAGLIMLVYILHENVLFKTYFRPKIFYSLWLALGKTNLILFSFVAAALLFVCTYVIAVLYDRTVRKVFFLIADTIVDFLIAVFNKLSDKIITKNE